MSLLKTKIFMGHKTAKTMNEKCSIDTGNINEIITSCEKYDVCVRSARIDLSSVDAVNFEHDDVTKYQIRLLDRTAPDAYTVVKTINMSGTYYSPEAFLVQVKIKLDNLLDIRFNDDNSIFIGAYPTALNYRLQFSDSLKNYFAGFIQYSTSSLYGQLLNVPLASSPLICSSNINNLALFYNWTHVVIKSNNLPMTSTIFYDANDNQRIDENILDSMNLVNYSLELSRGLIYVPTNFRQINMTNDLPLHEINLYCEVWYNNNNRKTIYLNAGCHFAIHLAFTPKE